MSYELQVLEGSQQGASTALPEGLAVTVSGAIDSDVVLRGADLAERRIALTAQADSLRVQVLQGEAQVDGRSVAAGQAVTVALASIVVLGGTHLGVVRVAGAGHRAGNKAGNKAGHEAGHEPAAVAVAGAAPPRSTEAAASPAAALAAAAQSPSARTWSRRLVGSGAALAAVSIGVLAFAYSAVPVAPSAAQRAGHAETLLHDAGLKRLTVRAAEGGELRVDGYLETTAQRARAERLLAGEHLDARWQVWVDEQVSNAVQDVYRVNGASASVESLGAGAVRVSTSVADPATLESIRNLARRDVPGLTTIEVRNTAPPQRPGATPVLDDPGKRISSIVAGDPPYVVTIDGTRYFEGALLPTGHRIAGIEEHQVVLELGGVRTPLVF